MKKPCRVRDRLGTYPVDAVMPFVSDLSERVGNRHHVRFEGVLVNMASDRMRCFLYSGTVCICCGLKARYFALERFCEADEYRLNLYGIKNGREVMFTKDHIVPKCKGGPSSLENYQTMCEHCNSEKGCGIETPILQMSAVPLFDTSSMEPIRMTWSAGTAP
ncbi:MULTISPECIES: HNH endonuclease [unclassified Methanoculleus]|uniref:HNH endonuclease signature motif containing protein n=1 Tax=Methanoculleus palmolei TaxID=72612 RepID=A0ABD8A6Q4_9EURY|nr:HNH endonuclease signature motif containing protein [Methanoculleus sp. UBA377]WOX54845.1 HNH endonuclease signature motif containing protein [Methanoculleus palmolei]